MLLFETVVFEKLVSGGVRPGLTHAVYEVDNLDAEYARIRASCFWVYAYPAFLRYAAHSAGGYWARILPQASEIAS